MNRLLGLVFLLFGLFTLLFGINFINSLSPKYQYYSNLVTSEWQDKSISYSLIVVKAETETFFKIQENRSQQRKSHFNSKDTSWSKIEERIITSIVPHELAKNVKVISSNSNIEVNGIELIPKHIGYSNLTANNLILEDTVYLDILNENGKLIIHEKYK